MNGDERFTLRFWHNQSGEARTLEDQIVGHGYTVRSIYSSVAQPVVLYNGLLTCGFANIISTFLIERTLRSDMTSRVPRRKDITGES
jgi:hypothetical protein